MSVLLLFNVGLFLIITVGEPGVHGAVVTGMQGWGVRTPCAAAVAAATCGLEGVVHIPNGITFVMGILSMMVAAGLLTVFTILVGITINEDGVVPKLH